MNVTVFGSGYVGLVTAACFAEVGNRVVCVDIDRARVELLAAGGVPIHEPGLDGVIGRARRAGRLAFTTDAAAGVRHGEAIFVAVGTPAGPDGAPDLRFVHEVAHTIGRALDHPAVVVNKSTVPVGTADRVRSIIRRELRARGGDAAEAGLTVISNPEFLKEGAAVEDFMRPDRIVVGTDSERARDDSQESGAGPNLHAHTGNSWLKKGGRKNAQYACHEYLHQCKAQWVETPRHPGDKHDMKGERERTTQY